MFWNKSVIQESVSKIEEVTNQVLEDYNGEYFEHEPSFTDRLIGSIETKLNEFKTGKIKWKAKTFTDRGPKSQESILGADFMGVLNVDLPDFRVRKGFLAQAKMMRPKSKMPKGEIDRLKKQSEKMLRYSPDSFVFIYHSEGVFIIPAISVIDSKVKNLLDLSHHNISEFFRIYFECFIGDRGLFPGSPHLNLSLENSFIFSVPPLSILYLEATKNERNE